VGVAVTAQRRPHRGGLRRRGLGEQRGQVSRLLAARRLSDDLGGGRADPGQVLQRAQAYPAVELTRWQVPGHLGGPPERPHPVGRRTGPLQLERDLPQRPNRLHLSASLRDRVFHRWTTAAIMARHPFGDLRIGGPRGEPVQFIAQVGRQTHAPFGVATSQGSHRCLRDLGYLDHGH
jgi:hypothetical protein